MSKTGVLNSTETCPLLRAVSVLALATCLLPGRVASQEPRVNVGLPAAGAIGAFGGGARLERAGSGPEGGVALDLGWIRGRSVRLQGEASVLRGSLTETVLLDPHAGFRDSTYRGHYYDLTVSVTAVVLAGGPGARVAPYLVSGIGVHALSSAFGPLVLDTRYNTNRFGSEFGAGLRVWLGKSGRRGLYVEARRVLADEVNRTVVRMGGLAFLGDLVRPRG